MVVGAKWAGLGILNETTHILGFLTLNRLDVRKRYKKKKAQVMYKTHITACPGTNIHATVIQITLHYNLISDANLP